jgi:tetratricopeptide (TPR) repeat protein/predicted Ser/Thr protein kinase
LEATVAQPVGSDPADVRTGTRIGRYVAIDRLGEGAMGVVWAAYDPELDRRLAVKLVRTAGTSEKARARLQREARALAKLNHPNVVAVHDVGTFGESVFVAMEYVRGQTLREWMAQTRTVDEVRGVFVQAGRGLAGAHAAGLVHRDFKPDNVMIGEDGRVRVMDFGLARGEGERDSSEDAALASLVDGAVPESLDGHVTGLGASGASGASGSVGATGPDHSLERLTRTGAMVGTPAYMAPEQFAGAVADERADQFAFCVALYEALYGERPFSGRSVVQLAVATAAGEIRPEPRGHAVPRWVRPIVVQGLSVAPGERWNSMESLVRRLDRDPSRRWRSAIGVGVAGATLGVLAWQAGAGAAPEPCAGAGDVVQRSWDETAADALRSKLVAVDVGHQDATAERVVAALDRYAQGLSDGRVEACRATRIDQVQSDELLDRRIACLDQRQDALSATVEVLSEPDADVLTHAVRAVGGLPGLERCADSEALLAALPPPEDPALARRYERSMAALVRVEARQRAGRIADAAELIERAAPEAEAIGHPGLKARALYLQGSVADDRGEQKQAAELLERSYFHALEHGVNEVATMASGLLVFVYGEGLTEHDRALEWSRPALAHARATGDDLALARVKINLGSAAFARKEMEQARDAFEEAYELRVAVLGEEHPEVATALNNRANAEYLLGNLELGERLHLQALRIREQTLGPEHIDVAMSLNNLATYARRRGANDEARARYDRALAIRRAALGEDHPSYAVTLLNSAVLEREVGNPEEALQRLEHAAKVFSTKLSPGHRYTVHAVFEAANIERTLGRSEAANHRVEVGFEAARAAGRETDALSLVLWLGERAMDDDKLEAAQRHLAWAVEVARRPNQPTWAVVDSLSAFGELLGRTGRARQAMEYLDEAVERGEHSYSGALARYRRAVVRADSGGARAGAIEDATMARTDCIESGTECRDLLLPKIDDWLAAHGAAVETTNE